MASSMEPDISTFTKISTLEAASVAVYLYVITIEAVTLITPKIQLYLDGYRICILRVATVGYRITAWYIGHVALHHYTDPAVSLVPAAGSAA